MLSSGVGFSGGATLWQSWFLPITHAGVLFREQGEPILNLANPDVLLGRGQTGPYQRPPCHYAPLFRSGARTTDLLFPEPRFPP